MTPVRLLHNPAQGALPTAFTRWTVTETTFPEGGSCGRCGGDRQKHLWILEDPDVDEQGGVIDCSLTDEEFRCS